MTRYFPEVVAAVLANFPERSVIDGEIVVADTARNTLDFEALQQRIHPAASRVNLLAEQTPASFIAFDLLALGDDDLTDEPLERAARCWSRPSPPPSRRCTSRPSPATSTPPARWFEQFEGAGLDGLIAKKLDLTYQPDKRVMSQDQARADRGLRGRRLPGAQVRPGRDRLAAARPATTTGACWRRSASSAPSPWPCAAS